MKLPLRLGESGGNFFRMRKRTEKQKKAARLSDGGTDRAAFILRFGGNVATLAGASGYHFRQSRGFPKGAKASLWHTTLLARCSVLYLLPRLTGKMRVSHDGHTRFARQESGQIFANGNEQKACSLSESGGGYTVSNLTRDKAVCSL